MRVGFIGLGSQGGPMARPIVEAGYRTTLWARRHANTEPYADTAADVAGTPAELAADSDLVCLYVVGDADVREVLEGADGALAGFASSAAGRAAAPVVAIHSTVHPDTCREMAVIAATQGVSLIDAPVSGGAPAVAAGRLLVMAGGDEDTLARCRPVFETYANPIVHLGGVGAGQTTKLLNNLLFTAHMATAVSTLELGARLRVSPEPLGEVIGNGSGNSFALGRILAGGGTLDQIAAHAGDLLRKDVRLISELADAAKIDPGVVLDTADATLALMGRPRRPVGTTPMVRSPSSWAARPTRPRGRAPVLAAYADPVLAVGQLGNGQRVKLVNNALFAAQIGLVTEAVRPAGELGLTEAEVLSALPHASSSGRAVLSVAAKGSVAAFADSVGDFLRKDVAVARALADRLGSDLGLLDPAIRAAVGSG